MSGGEKPTGREPSFAELIGKVRRVEHDAVDLRPPRPPAARRYRADDAPATYRDDWSDAAETPDAEEFQRGGLQHSVMRKLRRGQIAPHDEIDLHGLTVDAARKHLARFLEHARSDRLTCVRVIHGKGLRSPRSTAVLKPRVRHWLRHDDRVLAYVPAQRRDGGSGALYVLLRRRPAAAQ